jgi:hypothetical protein
MCVLWSSFISFCLPLVIILLFRHIHKSAISVISCVMPVCLSVSNKLCLLGITWLTRDRLLKTLMFGVFSENMLRKFKFR